MPKTRVNYPCEDNNAMARVKGSKNKNSEGRIIISSLSPEERIRFLANLIIEKALEDQQNGQVLLKKINESK